MTPPRREAILALLKRHLDEIRRFGVASIALFGSFARDQATPDSDVDVLVRFIDAPTFRQYMGLKLFLEELLGRPVDVVTPGGLRPRMREEVEREATPVA